MRGIRVAGVHDVAHVLEPCAELAAGVQDAKVAGGEAASFQERDRQRVAERELHGRRRRRREAVRARLLGGRQRQADVGLAAEGAVSAGGHRDQRDGVALGERDDRRELHGFARPGQGKDHVAVLHHAEVAVARFGGMDEGGRLARRGERRRDLARDVARLAHSGDDHPAARGCDRLHRPREGGAQAALSGLPHSLVEGLETAAFVVEGSQRRKDGAGLFVNHAGLYHRRALRPTPLAPARGSV